MVEIDKGPRTYHGAVGLRFLIVCFVGFALFSNTEVRIMACVDDLRVTGPCHFLFPLDHGPHPCQRMEWWYYSGNLESREGHALGFQLTFFRRSIRTNSERRHRWPWVQRSRWRADDLFVAHLAVSDVSQGRFVYAQKAMRGSLGLAGAGWNGDAVRIWVGDWSVSITGIQHQLVASSHDLGLHLKLMAVKDPVGQGLGGYCRKGPRIDEASYYYSITRLKVRGRIERRGKSHSVFGWAWMDHEYESRGLGNGLVGWDWFALQLANGKDLMMYFP